MSTAYEAPLPMQRLALEQACRSTGLASVAGVRPLLDDVAEPVLESAGKFAHEILSPLNRVGDREPARLEAGRVRTPPGFSEAYRQFAAQGWTSLSAPAEVEGQGLPHIIGAAVGEMWTGANPAFAMCPELAIGAIEALNRHGTPVMRARALKHLVRGEWTAAMCLTEPQAGSDLSMIRTRAEPDADAWRLFGHKIYISWGDHDLAENILHLVLARTPDAPDGIKGLSMFLVPKRVAAGAEVVDNDIAVLSLEHKMGIRASPTCALALGERDGARGWLIGPLHEGLACMFTVMNIMRLGVAVHSLGIAERAWQLAREHARTRRQGRTAAGPDRPIIEHADVRRMLLLMKSLVHAARCLTYTTAASIDLAHLGDTAEIRADADAVAGLLTPVAKAWCSEVGVEVASLGVQVHGGMGYIDDCEASQVYRDARIGPIFEGTNFIQAQDLIGRKILRDRGAALAALLELMLGAAAALPAGAAGLGELACGLTDGCRELKRAAATIIERSAGDASLIGAVGHHFLQWLGVLAGAWQWALTAADAFPRARSDGTARALVDAAGFYAAHVLPRAQMHAAIVARGAGPVTDAALAEL
jgi:acyl-CoA dehydrogenase